MRMSIATLPEKLKQRSIILFGTWAEENLMDVTMRMRVLFFISRGVLAWFFQTPYAYFGIGYYRIRSWFCRWLFQKNANGATFVSTRGAGGAKIIRKLEVKSTNVHA
ncbi:MAG: polysaccharide pyruvyl transferase family protein [Acidobacteria bacterium]|nr:polysaccharide pyruvyl transferase family protein [Acidobacteriota bacterium]